MSRTGDVGVGLLQATLSNPEVRRLDEGQRSPICNRVALTSLFKDAGMGSVETRAMTRLPVLRTSTSTGCRFSVGKER
jgi:hypothetical protein